MARAIAICDGGPLDGQLFSVELDEEGTPPALDSRVEVLGGVLYRPAGETKLPGDAADKFGWAAHEQAFIYLAEAS